MELTELNLVYEHVICKCYNCERGEREGAEAMHMDNLYGAYVDFLLDNSKEQKYQDRCKKISEYISKAIDKSALSSKKKEYLKILLEDANYHTIVFVLGELYALLFY